MLFKTAIDHLCHDLNNLEDAISDVEGSSDSREACLEATKELQHAITHLKVSSFGGLTALVSLIRQWGIDRQITGPQGKASVSSQYEKLREEFEELSVAINEGDQHGIIDAIGDMTVVLILLSELAGVRYETCLLAAWDEIKSRTGVMKDGMFVKSTELAKA
jgi:NTP pyrophosphatase (non-canonical NTP hydrolase)